HRDGAVVDEDVADVVVRGRDDPAALDQDGHWSLPPGRRMCFVYDFSAATANRHGRGRRRAGRNLVPVMHARKGGAVRGATRAGNVDRIPDATGAPCSGPGGLVPASASVSSARTPMRVF